MYNSSMELIKIAFCGKTYGPPCKVDEVFDFNRFFFHFVFWHLPSFPCIPPHFALKTTYHVELNWAKIRILRLISIN